jgi:hypothetical protein
MKVLVATHKGQGLKKNDFCFCNDLEPITLGFVCDRDMRDPDGGCGCGRSFTGIDTRKGTTTAIVVDMRHVDEGTPCSYVS